MILTLIDILAKFLPVIAILVAIVVARAQLKSARRATAVTIAKNHYRQTMELFTKNSDILFLGVKQQPYEMLVQNIDLMRRYRWLFSLSLFSLQELYDVFVAEDQEDQKDQKDKHWARTIIVVASLFRCHLLSSENFPEYIRSAYNPEFLRYVLDGMKENEHPTARIALSDFREAGPGFPIAMHQI